jgi:Ca2+/Na+ antiporter
MHSVIYTLKTIVAGSIFFVWIVRYREIIEEFKVYELPSWLRDLVGILKLSFAFMLFSDDRNVSLFGASGIITLMVAAVFTHLKVKNPLHKILPAICLIILNVFIFIHTYQR